ncbi:MAG: nitroreductase family protein [Microthrixaceae bacterium]
MELSDAMRTTGAVRTFTDEAVTDEVLRSVLDDARFAPSGGNRQGWRVAVVRDVGLRRRLADACAPVWNEYVAQTAAGETPFSVTTASSIDLDEARRTTAPNPLLDDLESAPVVLVVAVDLAALAVMDRDLDRPSIVGGASVYPFCQNLMLAARDRGLGGVMTTFVARVEPEVRTPLGLPDGHALAAMIVLGHPVRQLTRLRRAAVEEFTTVDRFDGQPFTG